MKFTDIFPVPLAGLSETDISLSETVDRWAQQEVILRRHELGEDAQNLIAPAMQKLLVEIGLQRLVWPEQSGGCALSAPESALTYTAVTEAASRADVGIGFGLANLFSLLSAFAIGENQNSALLSNFGPMFCEGGLPVIASLVLPHSVAADRRSIVAKVSAEAVSLEGKGARAQFSACNAGLYGIVCTDESGTPCFVLAPAATKGISGSAPVRQAGLIAFSNCDLNFTDASLPRVNLAFSGKDGLFSLMSWYALGCSAVCCGANLAAWEILLEWGKTRVIKGRGQVFKDNPLVAALMGKIGANIGTGRVLTYLLAQMLAEPDQYGKASSPSVYTQALATARRVFSDTMEALNNAMELMASAGYATEWNLERYWRDIKTVAGMFGSEPQQQVEMARHYFESREG